MTGGQSTGRTRRTPLYLIAVLLSTLGIALAGVGQFTRADVVGNTQLRSGGHSVIPVVVKLTSSRGSPLSEGVAVRAVVLSGDVTFNGTADRSVDLKTNDEGEVTLPVSPGTRNGPVVISLSDGDSTHSIDLSLASSVRKPIVVGVATVGAGPVPGWIEAPDNAPNGTTARRGMVSFYGTGEVARGTQATVAYDTADSLQQSAVTGPYLDNPNDRPFPIYGDQSVRYDDALSQNHLFARVENGNSSAMWGEFYARAAPAYAAGGYNILVNGAQVDAQGKNLNAGAFTATNNVAYGRAIISPTGLAIANQLLHPDIVVGSDVVSLVHLDRQTGAVLSQQTLINGSDYVIDYASGLLRFTNIILPYDDAFDPQIVTVRYQYGGPGAHSTMLGGNATLHLGQTQGSRLDAWYLNDAVGTGNLSLFGQALGGSTPADTWSISHEHSAGFLPITQLQYGTGGDAYTASFHLHGGTIQGALDFSDTSAAYDNPFGSYTAAGMESLRGIVGVPLGRITVLDASYSYAHNSLPSVLGSDAVDNSDAQAKLTLHVHPSKRLTYHVGLEGDWANSNGVPNPALLFSETTVVPGQPSDNAFFPPMVTPVQYYAGQGQALMADYGFDWKFTKNAALSISRLSSLGASSDPYDPPQTQAELSLDTGDGGKAFVRQLWQSASIQALAGSQAVQTYASTASSSTSVGYEQQAGDLTFQSGYSVDHTSNGTDLFDGIGVRGKVYTSKYLLVNGFLQVGQQLYATYGQTPATSSPYFVATGGSVDYSRDAFHATGQLQVRTGYNSGTTANLGAAGPVSPDVSLFGSYQGSYTQEVENDELRFGLAYRPSNNDRYVTLASLDWYKSNLTNYDAYVTNVAQVQELYRSSTRTEWAASVAYKLTGDAYFQPHTYIYGVRGDQRIGSRLDLASELHWSGTAPIASASATGFAVEAGYRLGSTMRFALGYNFSGFADPDTAINPTHRGLYVTLSSYIDRVFGWGKDAR